MHQSLGLNISLFKKILDWQLHSKSIHFTFKDLINKLCKHSWATIFHINNTQKRLRLPSLEHLQLIIMQMTHKHKHTLYTGMSEDRSQRQKTLVDLKTGLSVRKDWSIWTGLSVRKRWSISEDSSQRQNTLVDLKTGFRLPIHWLFWRQVSEYALVGLRTALSLTIVHWFTGTGHNTKKRTLKGPQKDLPS